MKKIPTLVYEQFTEPKVKEAAALLKQYYDALMEQGFTGAQAFQLVVEEIRANSYGGTK